MHEIRHEGVTVGDHSACARSRLNRRVCGCLAVQKQVLGGQELLLDKLQEIRKVHRASPLSDSRE